jgi:hypothetical protein
MNDYKIINYKIYRGGWTQLTSMRKIQKWGIRRGSVEECRKDLGFAPRAIFLFKKTSKLTKKNHREAKQRHLNKNVVQKSHFYGFFNGS